MAATLTLKRQGIAIELRRGRFDAVVDGDPVASLDLHETAEVPISPGHHTLQIHGGRYSSRPRSFEVSDGETVTFQLHGANLWPIYVASIVLPDLGISLKRLDSPR
jgi:hypothetical protein